MEKKRRRKKKRWIVTQLNTRPHVVTIGRPRFAPGPANVHGQADKSAAIKKILSHGASYRVKDGTFREFCAAFATRGCAPAPQDHNVYVAAVAAAKGTRGATRVRRKWVAENFRERERRRRGDSRQASLPGLGWQLWFRGLFARVEFIYCLRADNGPTARHLCRYTPLNITITKSSIR